MSDPAPDGRLVLKAYREGSDPSQSREILPFPGENIGFVEQESVCIERPHGTGWTFRVDDEPLQEAKESPVPVWRWSPGFYAGEVTAELEGPDGRVMATYLLDVAPDPRKVGRLLFGEMVREIWDEDPSLVLGSEPARTLVGDVGHEDDVLISLARLRLYGPHVIRALHAIASRPIHATRETRDRVPLQQARRVDRRTAFAAIRSPTTLEVIATGPEHTRGLGSDAQVFLDVPRVEYHVDGAANRCITFLARAVAHRIREVTRTLDQQSQDEALLETRIETRTALAPRWPARRRFLNSLLQQLRDTLSRPPFSEISRPEITAAGLNAAAAHPLYSRAHGLAWRILRMGVAGIPTDERLWVSPSWEIYERWCFVRLGRILRNSHPDFDWQRVRKHPSRARAAWRGTGKSQTIELLLQPVFGAWDRMPDRIWRSLSGRLIPDLVLTAETRADTWFSVFDAKYSVTRNAVLLAMGTAHVYHDALRYRGQQPRQSLLLLPALGGAPWLEQSGFHDEYGVGIAALGPAPTPEPAVPLSRLLALPVIR